MGNKAGKSISAVTNIYVAYMHTYILLIYFMYTSTLETDYDKNKKSNVIPF